MTPEPLLVLLRRTPLRRWVRSASERPVHRHTGGLVLTQLSLVLFWILVLSAITAVLYLLRRRDSENHKGWVDAQDFPTVAQVVPAIVIAIFVFAVGVAFVIAQVVPPARGTRAVDALRGRRLRRSITPAPALILGTVVLVFRPCFASDLSGALLIGSFLYTAFSLIFMLSILIDATNPADFKALLMHGATRKVRRAACAARRLPPCRDAGTQDDVWPVPRPPEAWVLRLGWREAIAAGRLQSATDDLYDIVRTLRGWTRVAARSNDSRELQEALEGILELARLYMDGVLVWADRLTAVPSIYWNHVDEDQRRLNPLNEVPGMLRPSPVDERETSKAAKSLLWEPPALVRRTATGAVADEVKTLPCTWFANELGRAVVRAVELAFQANTLLDRDTARLLNTLTNVAEMAWRKATARESPPIGVCARWALEWSAGIMIRYLTEVGLGVRRCPPDRIDWYIEPCTRLICLQRLFGTPDRSRYSRRLAVGAGAGAALVAEALVSAKTNAPTQPADGSSPAAAPGPVRRVFDVLRGINPLRPTTDPGERALEETVATLKRVTPGLLLKEHVLRHPERSLEFELIKDGWLEPPERVADYRSDKERFTRLLKELAGTSADVAGASGIPGRR